MLSIVNILKPMELHALAKECVKGLLLAWSCWGSCDTRLMHTRCQIVLWNLLAEKKFAQLVFDTHRHTQVYRESMVHVCMSGEGASKQVESSVVLRLLIMLLRMHLSRSISVG